MSVSLQKGQKISLTKESQGLNQMMVGLGWDEIQQKAGGFAGLLGMKAANMDCDASALLLKNGKIAKKEDIIYFGNLKHFTNSVRHMGDNLTGAGAGDDEQIAIELNKIPQEYDKIVIVINIYQADKRKQHFGMVKNAFCRVVDTKTNQELCRYNLTDDYSGMTSLIMGEVYRHEKEWKFNAIGQGTKDVGLGALVARYQA